MKTLISLGVWISIVLCIVLLPLNGIAKTYGWLISTSQNKAQKIEVDSNKIVQTVIPPESLRTSVELQDDENAIVASQKNNLLFIVYDKQGRHMGQAVKVYDLKQLAFKKDLGIISKDPDYELPKIISPPIDSKFYLVWWDAAKGVMPSNAVTWSVFNKTTLTKIAGQASYPVDVYDHVFYSADGSKLYTIGLDASNINIYDGSTLGLIEARSLENLWESPTYRKGVEYYSADKVLFAENLKASESDRDNFKYFVYDIMGKRIYSKISVNETGYGVLSHDGSKIIIIELAESSNNSLNKVNIYDSIAGKKLKYLDLTSKYKHVRILRGDTISPDSSKLYLIGKSTRTGSSTLIVVDLKTSFSVLSEIPIIDASWCTFFVDQ